MNNFLFKLLKNLPIKKILKISFLNFIFGVLVLIPVGSVLNYKSTGKFFISNKNPRDWRCLNTNIDPIFGSDKNNKCTDDNNFIGLSKEFPPYSKKNNTLDILLIGGSAAYDLTSQVDFERELNNLISQNKKLHEEYKYIRVFNASTFGSKQPSGLFSYQALEMLGYDFDAVIDFSGFNEIALSLVENYKLQINPIYPRQAAQHYVGGAKKITQNRLAFFLENLLWMHPMHQYLSNKNFYVFLKIYFTEKQSRLLASQRLGMNFHLPKSQKDAFDQTMKIWGKSVSNIHTLTKEKNIPYLLVIQPNQYLSDSKIFSTKEKDSYIIKSENELSYYKLFGLASFAQEIGLVIEKYYGTFTKENFNIPSQNILDLRYVFKNTPETMYRDKCCHLNQKGMEIISKEIANKIIFSF